MMRSLCLPIVFLLATFGSARASDLISQPEPAMLITPQTYNGSISNFAGDTSVANPSWFVQQTGAGSGAFTSGVNYNSAPGVSWQIANGTGRVQFYAAAQTNGPIENTYELAQAGGSSSIPCSTEEDLFASPIGAGAFKDANGNNVPSRASLSATLSNLSVISLQVGLTIPYEVISAKCPDINAAGYMAEVSLRSSTGYFIFFQVGFRSSAGLSGTWRPAAAIQAATVIASLPMLSFSVVLRASKVYQAQDSSII